MPYIAQLNGFPFADFCCLSIHARVCDLEMVVVVCSDSSHSSEKIHHKKLLL